MGKNVLKYFSIVATLLILVVTCKNADAYQKAVDSKVPNHLVIEVSDEEFTVISPYERAKIPLEQRKENETFEFTEAKAWLNGKEVSLDRLKTRGQTCLSAPRPCLGLRLKKGEKFKFRPSAGESEGIRTRRLNLVSMWEDRAYVRSRLGYFILSEFGLFLPAHQYVNVSFQNTSGVKAEGGLYLAVDKPSDHLTKKSSADSPCVSRRRYGGQFEIKEVSDGNSDISEKSCKYLLDGLYDKIGDALKNTVRRPNGINESEESLYQELSSTINLTQYLEWLALNHVLKSADYSDEVFFYFRNDGSIFDIMAWDTDDILGDQPHKGPWNSLFFKYSLEHSHLFSLEDDLDQLILADPYLLSKYLVAYESVLNRLTPRMLKGIQKKVQIHVSLYIDSSGDILRPSRLDADRKEPYTSAGIYQMLNEDVSAIMDRVSRQKKTIRAVKLPQGVTFGDVLALERGVAYSFLKLKGWNCQGKIETRNPDGSTKSDEEIMLLKVEAQKARRKCYEYENYAEEFSQLAPGICEKVAEKYGESDANIINRLGKVCLQIYAR